MAPEPASPLHQSITSDDLLASLQSGDYANDDEDPFSMEGASVAFIGLIIAFASIAVPCLGVLTENPVSTESLTPTALETDGSQSTPSLSLKRGDKSGG